MLYLAGGGDEHDSVCIDKKFAQHFGGKRFVYLPIAMDGVSPTYEDCRVWINSIFNPLGIREIVMWDDLNPNFATELQTYDAVYIGGGNTYKLLDKLRKTGFDNALKQFAIDGGTIYGGSAGAIVLGKDISTCAAMDSNETGLHDTNGLGLIGDYAIWCHYVEEHDRLIASYEYPIIAIPERSGLTFDGSVVCVVGFDGVTIFDSGHKKILLPNETMRML